MELVVAALAAIYLLAVLCLLFIGLQVIVEVWRMMR